MAGLCRFSCRSTSSDVCGFTFELTAPYRLLPLKPTGFQELFNAPASPSYAGRDVKFPGAGLFAPVAGKP